MIQYSNLKLELRVICEICPDDKVEYKLWLKLEIASFLSHLNGRHKTHDNVVGEHQLVVIIFILFSQLFLVIITCILLIMMSCPVIRSPIVFLCKY